MSVLPQSKLFFPQNLGPNAYYPKHSIEIPLIWLPHPLGLRLAEYKRLSDLGQPVCQASC